MIKIIKGTYGLEINGTVEARTPGSAPFALSEEREAELVALGVAEKVEAPENAHADKPMAALRKEAAERGVDVKGTKSKREVIAKLEATPENNGEGTV